MNGFKWMIIGSIISLWFSTFVFQQSVEVNQFGGGTAGEAAVEGIKAGALFWTSRICPLISLPAVGWYLQCPQIYCLLAPFFNIFLTLATTISGRAGIITSLAGVGLVLIGGKKRRTMCRVGNYFWIFMLVGIVGLVAIGQLYRTAAMSGWMGEDAYKKYMDQTKGKKGVLAILMGGRFEVFCGMLACLDKPIVGFGPWAIDHYGYAEEFLRKYGDEEDFRQYVVSTSLAAARGESRLIPAHSHIFGCWLHYGAFGLVFWIYALYVGFRYLKNDSWVIPQWYNWIATGMPSFVWGVFFSPFGSRIGPALFLVACLLAHAVRKGRQRLPIEMVAEIQRAERG